MALTCDVCGSKNIAWDYDVDPAKPVCLDCEDGGSVTIPDAPKPVPQRKKI